MTYIAHTWFERDRANVRMEDENGKEIFDLWDEAVAEAIEDGFLTPPRHPADSWLPSCIAYAQSQGLIK